MWNEMLVRLGRFTKRRKVDYYGKSTYHDRTDKTVRHIENYIL